MRTATKSQKYIWAKKAKVTTTRTTTTTSIYNNNIHTFYQHLSFVKQMSTIAHCCSWEYETKLQNWRTPELQNFKDSLSPLLNGQISIEERGITGEVL